MRIRKSEFWLSKFLSVYLDVFTNNFPGRHKCSSTPDSCSSYRGNHSEPLDRWRTHRTSSVAIEVISWCRTCLPMANELGKETGKVKTTLHGTSWYSGTATQHYTFHGVACMATINYMIHAVRLQIEEFREFSKFQ